MRYVLSADITALLLLNSRYQNKLDAFKRINIDAHNCLSYHKYNASTDVSYIYYCPFSNCQLANDLFNITSNQLYKIKLLFLPLAS